MPPDSSYHSRVTTKAQQRALDAVRAASLAFTTERSTVKSSSLKGRKLQYQIEVPSIDHALKAKASRSFKEFVEQAMPIAEPGIKYLRSWATDCVCDHLQAVCEGIIPLDPAQPPRLDPIRDIILNIPPRSLKSTLVEVLLPAWVWINWPEKRFIITSYSHRNIMRDSRKCRNLLKSTWYQARWGDKFKFLEDSDTIARYDNDRGGFRYAVSISGQIVGEGADIIIADDLHQLGPSIHSRKTREKPNDIWDDVMSTRLSDAKTGCQILISQRGHGDDHTGHVLARDDGSEWVHVRIPAEFEAKFRCTTRLPWADPRTYDGELIDERRFGPKEILKLKKKLGSWNTAAQLQQRPVPLEGGIFEHDWWQFYNPACLPPPNEWDDSCISCDMTFGSQKDGASYTVFQAWCRVGAKFYLIDQRRGMWKYTQAKRRLKQFIAKHSGIWTIYVENKALGPAILDELEEEGVTGLMPINCGKEDGDKEARAQSVSPLVEAGNVYLPDPSAPGFGTEYEWVNLEFFAEVDVFPLAPTDDQVDTMSQALRKLRANVAYGVGSDDFTTDGTYRYENNEHNNNGAGVPGGAKGGLVGTGSLGIMDSRGMLHTLFSDGLGTVAGINEKQTQNWQDGDAWTPNSVGMDNGANGAKTNGSKGNGRNGKNGSLAGVAAPVEAASFWDF